MFFILFNFRCLLLKLFNYSVQVFANPGDTGAVYIITVENTGNLTAYNVTVTDSLPSGFKYSDNGPDPRVWTIGNLEPDERREIKYTVDIDDSIAAGAYINTAKAKADNNSEIYDQASLEIRVVEVLAETGFRLNQLWIILVIIFALVYMSKTLNTRVKYN